jgi:hypothetical protein
LLKNIILVFAQVLVNVQLDLRVWWVRKAILAYVNVHQDNITQQMQIHVLINWLYTHNAPPATLALIMQLVFFQ